MASTRAKHASPLKDPGPLRFSAELLRSEASGAACFVHFPWDLKETYGKGNLVPVNVTFDGRVPYRGSLAMMGGARAMLLCRKDALAQLGKGAGDPVDVEVRVDLSPRTVEVPGPLAAALKRDKPAQRAWAALSPSCQREYAQWIAEAKREETRAARVQKALPLILAKQRLKG